MSPSARVSGQGPDETELDHDERQRVIKAKPPGSSDLERRDAAMPAPACRLLTHPVDDRAAPMPLYIKSHAVLGVREFCGIHAAPRGSAVMCPETLSAYRDRRRHSKEPPVLSRGAAGVVERSRRPSGRRFTADLKVGRSWDGPTLARLARRNLRVQRARRIERQSSGRRTLCQPLASPSSLRPRGLQRSRWR